MFCSSRKFLESFGYGVEEYYHLKYYQILTAAVKIKEICIFEKILILDDSLFKIFIVVFIIISSR